jgi:hypothetical protein
LPRVSLCGRDGDDGVTAERLIHMNQQAHDIDEQRLRAEIAEDEPEEGDPDDDDLEDDDGALEDDDDDALEEEDYGAEGGDMSEPGERGITPPSASKVDQEIDQTFPASDPPANY